MRLVLLVAVALAACALPHPETLPARDGSAVEPVDASTAHDTAAHDSYMIPAADAHPEAAPALRCTAPARTDATLTLVSPFPTGASTIVTASAVTGYTNVVVTAVSTDGAARARFVDVSDGPPFAWRFALGPLAPGNYCVRMQADGAPDLADVALLVVPQTTGGVPAFKVVENHQWTCDEQPDWGNFVDVYVTDENGAPMPNTVVEVDNTGNNNGGTGRFANPPPTSMVTDANGYARFANYWPSGHYADGTNAMFVFSLHVVGAPSDTATEITSGFWESITIDGVACNWCDGIGTARNVYGHWSYTVRFQRAIGATETCAVTTDHAGMSHCPEPMHDGHPDGEVCAAIM